MLSPIIDLKRTEQIVNSVMKQENVNLPITKVVLAPFNYIVYPEEPYQTKFIGKREYDEWFSSKRELVYPLKNQQIKAASLLLNTCRTTAVRRPEWESVHTDQHKS